MMVSLSTTTKKSFALSKGLTIRFLASAIFNFGFNFITTAEYVYFREILASSGLPNEKLQSAILATALSLLCVGVLIGGIMNDRTRTRFGQRGPAILGGALVAAFFLVCIPLITEIIINYSLKVTCLFLVLGAAHLALGFAYAPWLALVVDLFSKKERVWACTAINIFSAAGAAVSLVVFSILLDNKLAWVIWVITASMIATTAIITFLLLPKNNPEEPSAKPKEKTDNFSRIVKNLGGKTWFLLLGVNILWGFSSHMVETGLIDSLVKRFSVSETVAATASNLLMGAIVVVLVIPLMLFINKAGKKISGIITSILYGSFCIALALMQNFKVIYSIIVLGAASNILLSTLQIALPADVVRKGREASYMGIFFIINTSIKPVATMIQGVLLEGRSSSNTLSVFGGYPWVFLFAAIGAFGAIIILLFVKPDRVSARNLANREGATNIKDENQSIVTKSKK